MDYLCRSQTGSDFTQTNASRLQQQTIEDMEDLMQSDMFLPVESLQHVDIYTDGNLRIAFLTLSGNVTVNNATLVIDVTNSTVDDGTEIPVIVFNGTFSGSGITDVEVNGGDDESSETQGQQK